MTTAERKYHLISRITSITDDHLLSELEAWLETHLTQAEDTVLTEEGKRELSRRQKEAKENPSALEDWRAFRNELKKKHGLQD